MGVFRIPEFSGVNINNAPGYRSTEPTSIKGFQFARGGALTTDFGLFVESGVTYADQNFGVDGFTPDGLSGWVDVTNGVLYLFDGDTVYSVSGSFTTTPTVIPTVGFSLSDLGLCLLKDKDGVIRTDTALVATITNGAYAGSTLSADTWMVFTALYFPTALGAFIAAAWAPTTITTVAGDGITVTATTLPAGAKVFVYYGKKTNYDIPPYIFTDSASAAGVITDGNPLHIGQDVGGALWSPNGVYYQPVWRSPPNLEIHNRRVWGVTQSTPAVGQTTPIGATLPSTPQDFMDARTIAYTEMGYPNLMLYNNWLSIPFRQSTKVTGLRSCPAGLLVFGESETMLVRGDPANPNSFSVQLVSGEVGHDAAADAPGVLGGAVFSIYNGRIYQFVFGMGDVDFGTGITEIGHPVWSSNTFAQVVGEPRTNQVVARTTANNVYRYDLHTKKWLNDEGGTNLVRLLPNPDASGTRYLHT